MSFRIRGFLIHFFVSFVFALIASYVVFWVWYPSPLGQAIGVTSIVLLLLGVDLVIGPLLTLAVCKEGKKNLKLDLSVIVILQLGAFIYGIHTLAQGRPVWIVLYEKEFHIIRAYDADNEYRQHAKPEYMDLIWSGPGWAAVRAPKNKEKRSLFEGLNKGISFHERIDFYEPISNQSKNISLWSIDVSQLNQFNNPETVREILSKWSRADAYLPLSAHKSLSVLIHRESSTIIAIVNLRPS